jgi:two-component system OmpR family response regulator
MRVLVADDQLRMAALLKRGLREDGHTVDVALNSDEALWHASEFTYDAVVLDVMLPGPDGAHLCKRLRERDRRTPVLMLTRKDRESDRVRGLDAGADAFLVEPFSFDDFTAQLSAMTHRRTGDRANGLKVGELLMNSGTHQAWRGESELSLSSKEFALLRLFMANPGQCLSRDHIFERIWDCTHRGSSNLVDQYVLYLRRKVDRPFGVRQIETVRGLGYRLRDHPVATR